MKVRGIAAAFAIAASALLMSGCSGEEESANPYAREYNAALENATSDFERNALEDGIITKAEYDEANQLWLACMEKTFPPDGLVTVALLPGDNGLYNTEVSNLDEEQLPFYDEVSDACEKGTTMEVGFLYGSSKANPNNEDYLVLVAACLARNDFVGDDYTKEHLLADLAVHSDGGVTAAIDPRTGELKDVGVDPAADLALATGFDPTVDEAQACFVSPVT